MTVITEPVRRQQSKREELIAMLSGMHVVTDEGRDRGHRLIMCNTQGVLDGCYVFHRETLTQMSDQFTVQVGSEGACTLLANEFIMSWSHSDTARRNATWVLVTGRHLSVGNSCRSPDKD